MAHQEKQTPSEVTNAELVGRTLAVGWACGIISFLCDLDHAWSRLGLEEPFNFTGWVGRPAHTPLVFLLYAVIGGLIILALTKRWDVDVPVRD